MFISQSLSRAESRSHFWKASLELGLGQFVQVIAGAGTISGVFFKAGSIISEMELQPELDLEPFLEPDLEPFF